MGTSESNAGKKEYEVVFQPSGKRVTVKEELTILEAAQKAGVKIWSICGGKGTCGKCKVILKKGKIKQTFRGKYLASRYLSEDDLKLGYRIACLTIIKDNLELVIPPESRLEGEQILLRVNISPESIEPSSVKVLLPLQSQSFVNERDFEERIKDDLRLELGVEELILSDIPSKLMNKNFSGLTATVNSTLMDSPPRIIGLETADTTIQNYGLAIDLGTTTIVVFLVNLADGEILETASDYNGQIIYGEDILSRIEYASEQPEKLQVLQSAVVDTINLLVQKVTSKSNISASDITDVCLAGNTPMTYLLLRKEPSELSEVDAAVSRKPYALTAEKMGFNINPQAGVYVLSCASRFLGGDVVGDLLASGMLNSQEISVMVDMGTNGQAVIGNKEWLFSASCASGPAFEGWEVTCGVRGVAGAIDQVKINPKTYEAEYTVIGADKSEVYGICGSGMIDLVAEMFSTGIINSKGVIQPKIGSKLIRGESKKAEYVIVPASNSGREIVVTQRDVNNFLESKAAVAATIITLMRKAGLSVGDVKNLYLAGAFGSYMNLQNAIKVGLFPRFSQVKIIQIGNGSLAGAYLNLVSKKKRKEAEEIVKLITYFDFGVDNDFMDEYDEDIRIPGNPKFFV